MEENVASKQSSNRGRRNWRSRGRGGRYIHPASEEHDNAQPSLNFNWNETVVSQKGSSICGRRSWQPRGRNGIRYACKKHENVHMFQTSDSSTTATAESYPSSSHTADHNPASRPRWRGRGNGRPWRARSTNRSDSVPVEDETDCSSFRQVEHCSSSSSVASTTDASEDVDAHQNSNFFTVGTSIVINNCGKNARQRGQKRFMHGNRGHSRSRCPMRQQSDSAAFENNETECKVSGSTPFDGRTRDDLELGLVSSAEANEYVDDDVFKARNVLVTGRGKQRKLNTRAHGVHDHRRGPTRAGKFYGVLERKRMLVSQETDDAESLTSFLPVEVSVRDTEIEQESSPGFGQSGESCKNCKQKAASAYQESETANTASVSAAGSSENDAAVKTAVVDDVKPANVGKCGKNSASKPSVHVDENLLFWHLVNEHNGKCCINELKNQLNTSDNDDADNAIAIIRPLKRVKILVNESDKWKSVAFVFVKGLRMCLNVKAGCKRENCPFLHVCPDYVTGSCNHGYHCRFGHNVRIPCNELCLQNSGIPDSCSSESVLTIARSSNTIMCAGYNGVGQLHCHSPSQCIRLHACNHFFRGRCLVPNSECILGHELTSEHNVKLLTLYEVKHLLNNDKSRNALHRMILPVNSAAHTLTSGETICKTLQTVTTPRTDKPHISNFVAAFQLSVSTGVQMDEHEVKNTVIPSLVSDDGQVFAVSAIPTQSPSSHQAKQSVTLPRFVVGRDLTSKASSVAADTQLTKLGEDKRIGSFQSASTVQPKTAELTASIQSDDEVTGVKSYQLLSDKSESAQMSEAVTTTQPDAVQRFATRRSQSTKTLEFRADQCQMYIKHLCNESNECSVRHDLLPYLWRVQDAGKWVAFVNNVSIEEAFCNPDNSEYIATYQVHIYLDMYIIIA